MKVQTTELPMYSVTRSGRTLLTTRLTSHLQRKTTLDWARLQLMAAAVIVTFVTLSSLLLVIWKIKSDAPGDTTAATATALTYRLPNATSTIVTGPAL
ncbi:hypothetical protein MTO96_017610 [Rhipicephalus appendiculatus]